MVPKAQDGMTTFLLWGNSLVLDAYLLLQIVLAVLVWQCHRKREWRLLSERRLFLQQRLDRPQLRERTWWWGTWNGWLVRERQPGL